MVIQFVWCHILSIFSLQNWHHCNEAEIVELLKKKDEDDRKDYLAKRPKLLEIFPLEIANLIYDHENGEKYDSIYRKHVDLSKLRTSCRGKHTIALVPFVLGYIELLSFLAFFILRCVEFFDIEINMKKGLSQEKEKELRRGESRWFTHRTMLFYVSSVWLLALTIHVCGIIFYYCYCKFVHQHNLQLFFYVLSKKLLLNRDGRDHSNNNCNYNNRDGSNHRIVDDNGNSNDNLLSNKIQHGITSSFQDRSQSVDTNAFLLPFLSFQMWCNLYPLECLLPEWRNGRQRQSLVNNHYVMAFILSKYASIWLCYSNVGFFCGMTLLLPPSNSLSISMILFTSSS
ncbi:hypothetical protein RFI_15490 [Reticulomyxa filosa]|uniref:Uncharacterized protein n=1 Tax=Reticulomyxa filosa TaxID=46433 RepID=X6N718_RETFI|nr:hypothetical protein RFI_15490 [Reticulomyxa filosa]|eukprot:ETO21713.1 hypothetical protein RFI_15490 [Reticulomyxa filosa]